MFFIVLFCGSYEERKKKALMACIIYKRQRQNTAEWLAQMNSSKLFISHHNPNTLQQVAENIFEG